MAVGLAAAVLVAVPPDADRPASADVALPLPPTTINQFFVIGVDLQPSSLFQTWKDRGINTVVRMPGGLDPAIGVYEEWDQKVIDYGLRSIRRPRPNPADDLGRFNLLALSSLRDEPERMYCNYQDGRAEQDRQERAAEVAQVPFFTNYIGDWIVEDPVVTPCTSLAPGEARMVDYCGIRGHSPNEWCYGNYFAATDWIAFDVYPKNRGQDINRIREAMARIDAAYPDGNVRPRIVYIEASNSQCDTTYPNQWHTVYQAVQAVITGARGIIYFPHGLTPGCASTIPDNSTLRIQEEMTRLNFALQSIPGSTLNGTVDPAGVTFESGDGVDGQIKWGTRADATHAYYFTENNHGSLAHTHVVRFHGISNCAGKVVTVINDKILSNAPYEYDNEYVTLNAACQTTVPLTWSAYRWKIFKVAKA